VLRKIGGKNMRGKMLLVAWLVMAVAIAGPFTAPEPIFPGPASPIVAQAESKVTSQSFQLDVYRNYETIIVFHPDDIVHRQDNPLNWLNQTFAYGSDAAEGRIVGFNSEYWGPFIRLTTEDLNEREQKWKGGSWTFRYKVRHGKVFAGTAENLEYIDLPLLDGKLKLLPENGFELANGFYAVTVYPIEWRSEPGALTADGNRAANALPEYVIVFKPVDNLSNIETAPAPVYLETSRNSVPIIREIGPGHLSWAQTNYEQSSYELAGDLDLRSFIVVSPGTAVITGFMRSVRDTENLQAVRKSLKVSPVVVTAEAEAGALGVVADLRAWEGPDTVHPVALLTLQGGRLVRIRTLEERQGLTWAKVEPVRRPPSTVSARKIAALKQDIEEAAQRSESLRMRLLEGDTFYFLVESIRKQRKEMGKPDLYHTALAKRDGKFRAGFYELDRMQSMTSAEALTTWLIFMLDLPVQQGLELLALSDYDRVAELSHLLTRY
jgi:hypothetical protein